MKKYAKEKFFKKGNGYEEETKEVEEREYLYLDTETLQLLQRKANK